MTYLLGVSLALQVVAVFMALRLFRFTRRDAGWALISLALAVMASRRLLTLLGLFQGRSGDFIAEWQALIISVLFVSGLAWVTPFFESLRAANQNLRQSESRQRALLEAVPDLIFLHDRQGVYVGHYHNKTHYAYIPAKDFLGKKPTDVLPAPLGQQIMDLLARTLETGAMQTLEYALPMGPDLLDWEARFVPLEGKDQVMVIVRDLTDSKKLARQVSEREIQYRTIFEVVSDGLCVHDDQGHVLDANPAMLQMFGYTLEEMSRLKPQEFTPLQDAQKALDFLEDLRTKGRASLSSLAQHRNGSTFHTESIGVPFVLHGKNLLLTIVRDVSIRVRAEEERRRLETQLQHTQKLESLGVLAGGIAHDFNNLLTGMLGHASLAGMQLDGDSPVRHSLGQIELAAQRASELTRQLLAYAGKGRFIIQPILLSNLVQEMADLLQTVISKKAILRYDFAPNLPAIQADATQIRQIVMNLITNASDAIGDKSGVIAIRTGMMFADEPYLRTTFVAEELEEGTYVFLEVSDTGVGMSSETLEKVFDPFFTTKFTGRGLGLAAVLGIVRGHKGTIKVYSEPRRGTNFKVLFPASLIAASAETPGPPAPEEWVGAGTILVIDDEETVRAVARATLQGIGFKILLANNGRDGLEVYRQHRDEIVCVLLDLTMPHLGGEETFRELRLLQPGIQVVLMSGYNEQEITNEFAGKGLAGFLQKPFRAADLLGIVRRTLTST